MSAARNLTKAQAMSAYRRICKQLGEAPHPEVVEQGAGRWPDGPLLVRDFALWSSPTKWAVVWEEGPYEWAIGHEQDARVFAEPVCSFALGLYPA